MDQLTIAAFQQNILWEDPYANIKRLTTKLEQITRTVDLIVFPEMFNTGFTMNASDMAEDMQGITIQWMMEQSKRLESVITGSLIIKEENRYYNRLLWVQPDGTIAHYDKNYLFSLAKEDRTFSSGNQSVVMNLKGWKICPLICYDLRFPELARNRDHYGVLIYVANFPEKRDYAWKQLLIARAIENQCYTVGVNRVGKDAMGISYIGNSCFIDFAGHIQTSLMNQEGWLIHTLHKHPMDVFRRTYPFLKDMKPG